MPISMVEPKKWIMITIEIPLQVATTSLIKTEFFLENSVFLGIIVASNYRNNPLITRNKTLTIMAIQKSQFRQSPTAPTRLNKSRIDSEIAPTDCPIIGLRVQVSINFLVSFRENHIKPGT